MLSGNRTVVALIIGVVIGCFLSFMFMQFSCEKTEKLCECHEVIQDDLRNVETTQKSHAEER